MHGLDRGLQFLGDLAGSGVQAVQRSHGVFDALGQFLERGFSQCVI